MERLTQKDEQGNKLVLKNSVECVGEELRHWSINQSPTGTQTIRGYAIDKFAEYEDLEEQGFLLKLPCKVGDKIYSVIEDGMTIIELEFSLDFYARRKEDFGKTVFATKEEAEDTLNRMKREE